MPYWHLASEFNRWGQFYQADLEVGVTVALSEDKVRRARRDFQRRGWVEAKPGFRARGRNVATTYQAVKWATAPEEGAGDWWAPMHRYGFETVLEWIRSGRFTHSDVVTYICLAYLQHRTRGKGKPSEFFVTKQTLRDLTALPDALARVKHLYQGFQFTGGTRLFEYADLYHKLEFASWATFRDPSEDPNNATIAATRGADIRKRLEAARVKRKAKSHELTPEDLVSQYQNLVCRHTLYAYHAQDLEALGHQYGIDKVAATILRYSQERGRTARFCTFKRWAVAQLG